MADSLDTAERTSGLLARAPQEALQLVDDLEIQIAALRRNSGVDGEIGDLLAELDSCITTIREDLSQRRMDGFIARENIRHFKRQLESCGDERQRETLTRLLAEEEAKLRELKRRDQL